MKGNSKVKTMFYKVYDPVKEWLGEHDFIRYFVLSFYVCCILSLFIAAPLTTVLLSIFFSPWYLFTFFVTLPFDLALGMYIHEKW